MDPERQIRFLYPPLFFVAAIAWGLRLDSTRSIGDIVPLALFQEPGSAILAVVAGGGVVVAALGLLINTIPWMLFRVVALARGTQSHEAVLSNEGLDRIRDILGLPVSSTQDDALFLTATFDHRELHESIHKWLLRRWNAFNVNSSVVSALTLAVIVGGRLGIHLGKEWLLTSLAVGSIFAAMAWWAWRDTMGMLEFQATLMSKPKAEASSPTPNTSCTSRPPMRS